MDAIKAALADGLLSFMWVSSASTLGILTSLIAGYFGLIADDQQTQTWMMASSALINITLVFILLSTFGIIADLLGGASFNPTASAAFSAAGLGSSLSLYSAALRFPAQAAGAAGGALAIMEIMPVQYRDMVTGPSLKVDVHTGAIAEGVLTFAITFLSLLIVVKGPRNSLIIRNCLLLLATIVLMVAGSAYTGPSMNPANAFGWAYVSEKHKTWEHFYVYWMCPFVGAILGAWIFRAIFKLPPPLVPKQKKL